MRVRLGVGRRGDRVGCCHFVGGLKSDRRAKRSVGVDVIEVIEVFARDAGCLDGRRESDSPPSSGSSDLVSNVGHRESSIRRVTLRFLLSSASIASASSYLFLSETASSASHAIRIADAPR